MPAVELSRLRAQLPRLTALFARPLEFRRALTDLCETYADPTFRAGRKIIPSYRMPQLVVRQMELVLGAACREHPEQALDVVDELWGATYLEPRMLAVYLLGQVPLSQAEGILERLRKWANPSEDTMMLEALLIYGTLRLRTEGPDALMDLFGEWLNDSEIPRRLIGLKAMHSLANDPEFENLPPLFNQLFPLVRAAPQNLFNELSALLTTLARREPTETAYFLRQVLASPTGKDTPRLTRRIMPLLSEAQQESLKSILKSRA
jgi:hypothetical protein